MNFLEKIQSKPKRVRQTIFWLTFLVSGFFVVFLWFVSFEHSLPNIAEEPKELKESFGSLNEIKKEIPSLGRTLKAAIKSFFEKTETLKELEEKNKQAGETTEFQQEEEPQLEKIEPVRLPDTR